MDFMGIAAAFLLLILSAMLFGGKRNAVLRHEIFQSTPLTDVNKLTDVPGVGEVNAHKLEEANIDSAVKLMGQFLVCFCSMHGSQQGATRG